MLEEKTKVVRQTDQNYNSTSRLGQWTIIHYKKQL